MSRITVRNIELRLMRELRRRAAERGCSVEEEARDILRIALSRRPVGARNSAASARAGAEPSGEREYDLSPHPISEPPPLSPRGQISEPPPPSPRGPIREPPPRSPRGQISEPPPLSPRGQISEPPTLSPRGPVSETPPRSV